jgi:hypothetical protein
VGFFLEARWVTSARGEVEEGGKEGRREGKEGTRKKGRGEGGMGKEGRRKEEEGGGKRKEEGEGGWRNWEEGGRRKEEGLPWEEPIYLLTKSIHIRSMVLIWKTKLPNSHRFTDTCCNKSADKLKLPIKLENFPRRNVLG